MKKEQFKYLYNLANMVTDSLGLWTLNRPIFYQNNLGFDNLEMVIWYRGKASRWGFDERDYDLPVEQLAEKICTTIREDYERYTQAQ